MRSIYRSFLFLAKIIFFVGVPLSLYSGHLINSLGYDGLVTLMFMVYSLRMLFYPLLAQSHCLYLLEMLKPLGNNLAMIAGAHFIMANTHQQNISSLEVSRNKINTKDLDQMKALENQ